MSSDHENISQNEKGFLSLNRSVLSFMDNTDKHMVWLSQAGGKWAQSFSFQTYWYSLKGKPRVSATLLTIAVLESHMQYSEQYIQCCKLKTYLT